MTEKANTPKKRKVYPIVEPSNARQPHYRAYLEQILASKQCPFCPDGATHKDQKILYKNTSWYLIQNVQTLPNSKHYLVVVPFRHVSFMADITTEEWQDFTDIMNWAEDHLPHDGIAYYWRQGDPLVTGATVSHVHVQAVVPDNGPVTVYFGPFPKT